MCIILESDLVLGNLFLKLMEREIDEIELDKIYDFVYYSSVKLNETENTLILVSRDSIMNFVEYYSDDVKTDETATKIIISRNEESLNRFKKRYEYSGRKFSDGFDYAFKKIAA